MFRFDPYPRVLPPASLEARPISGRHCRKDQIAFWLRRELHVFSNMKIAARCLIAVVMLAAASFAFAHPFKSKIITTSPLMITVGDDQVLNIKNFTQQGGTDRGVLSVTFKGGIGGTANVRVCT